MGSTGEVSILSPKERKAIIRRTAQFRQGDEDFLRLHRQQH
ncbi:MAG: hypothetical protein ACR5LF_14345 [Symbiopectobacterium sp.]